VSFPRRRRDEMLAAAAELFYEHGYAATSTADIAERMGIQRGSVYYYFDTKEGLLLELIEDVYRHALASLERVRASEDDAAGKLRALISDHVHAFTERLIPGAIVINESRSLSPANRDRLRRDAEAYEKGIVELLAEGQAAGLIRAELDPRLASLTVLGALNWVHRWYRPGDPASPDAIAAQFADVLLGGLLSQTGVTVSASIRQPAAVRTRPSA
jgi:TetR/AcrR family transcriptional regulator, cholesterol catabolism regulator